MSPRGLSADVSLDSPDPILERIHIEDTSNGGKGKESSFLVYQSSLLDEVSSPVRREVANRKCHPLMNGYTTVVLMNQGSFDSYLELCRSFFGKVINRISDVENGKLEIKEKSIRNNMLVNVHNKALLSGIAYCISSCSMILVNKYVLSSYNFNAGISLMLYQNFVSVVVVSMLSFFGLISTQPLTLRLIKVWLPVNVIFVGMLITSILSLKYLNVAMVTVLKNVTNVITAVGEMYVFNKRHDSRVWTALFLMPALVLYLAILLFLFFLLFSFDYTSVEQRVYQKQPLYSKEVEIVSAVSGGITDLSFHATGYTWQIINCFLTASYSLTLRRIMDTAKQVTKSGNLDEFSMVLLNNTLSLPLGLLLVLLFNEVDYLSTTPLLQLPTFWIVTTLSGFLGLAISFTSMWFLHQTSATTYSLVGSLNKIPLSAAGIILFNVPTRLDNTASICFGLLAGVFFARAKMQEKSQS